MNRAEHLEGLSGLVIPGGESTTIGLLLKEFRLDEAIRQAYAEGLAVMGTCAGLILLAKDIEASDQPRLGLMDITVKRNAFGRQVQSFEADLEIPELGEEMVRGVFIRAPYISKAGPGVRVMCSFRDKIVLARQGRLIGAAFHPELIGETRLHRYFVELASGSGG